MPLHGSPSEVAITAPHAAQPQPDSSLARRIDAQLAALGDEFEDSPFSEPAQSIVQPFTGSEGSAQVMTSASRATFESFAAVDTSPAMPSYPDDADVTSQQPLAEVEELVARSMEPSLSALRRPGETHEVDPDDIEADIEVAPPARRHASVVQRMPQPPKTAPSGKPSK